MYSVKSLEHTIRNLFRGGIGEHGYSDDEVTALLEGIDFQSLLQAVRHNAKTVYAYTTRGKHSKSFNYRGADLFGQRAALLYDSFDQNTAEAVVTARTYELWLLEDMSIAVTACVSVSYDGGAYETEYREIKDSGPWDCGLFLDAEALADKLDELCEPVWENEQPVYEL